MSTLCALLATGILIAVALFQVALAAGAPLGHLAWGGQHRILPNKQRVGSALAAPVLILAAWVLLARVGFVSPGSGSAAVRVATWALAALFALNTLGNLASRSRAERLVMTPLTLILTACYVVTATTGP